MSRPDCEECGEPADCSLPDLANGPRMLCRECCPFPHEGDEGDERDTDDVEESAQLTLWESVVDKAQATFSRL